jgi:TonB family protein
MPVLLYKKEPAYTQAAIAAKLEGTVTLAFTIGTDGKPRDISVVNGIGMGLDEQAVAAVSQWKFKPASQDGTRVEASTTATVNFHLIHSAPQASDASTTSPPVLLFKTEPEYSAEALKAKHQGTVVLYVLVGTDGKASNIRVLRSLGLGLDEKAVEAVKQWRFKPASTNGSPVEAPTTVTVDFRLTGSAPQGNAGQGEARTFQVWRDSYLRAMQDPAR